MSEVMPTEIKEKWAEICSAYQEMKAGVLETLEYPDSTEEQMMQAALSLRNARMQLERVRVTLTEKFPRYTISTKGVAVKLHRTPSTTTTN
jgi:nicotinamide mononucleotide adenylyltransferase